MDKLINLIEIQNNILLNKIANDKFKTDEEKRAFINKYSKHNFHIVKVTRNDYLLKYSMNRINNIFAFINE